MQKAISAVKQNHPQLPEDLIFTNAQKLTLSLGMVASYWRFVAPLMAAPAKSKAQ